MIPIPVKHNGTITHQVTYQGTWVPTELPPRSIPVELRESEVIVS